MSAALETARQRRRLLQMGLVLVVVGSQPAWAQRPNEAAPVVVAQVAKRTVTAAQSFVGTVMPEKHAVIGSAVDGRVVEFEVEEGDRVEAKQKLAQLLTATISLELASAEAELQLRQQQLQELENGTRIEEIEQARARMAAARARHEFQQASLGRLEKAYESRGAVTDDQLEEARAAATEAQESYLEMQAAHDLAAAGPRPEVILQARAQVAYQQAVVDRLLDQIKKHSIISRFAGYVVKEHTEIGQWVNRGDPVAEVAALDNVDVVVQVVEQSVPFIRIGDDVRVEIPALPDEVFVGQVQAVVPQADQRARTFPVKIRLANDLSGGAPLIQAGMYARAMLAVGKSQQAVLAPKDAIVLGGPRPAVFVATGANAAGEAGSVESVAVDLGVAHGAWIQVIGAIRPEALVVVQGNERLRPGARVKLLEVLPDLPSAGPRGRSGDVAAQP